MESLGGLLAAIPRLLEPVAQTRARHIAKLEMMGCEVIAGGLVGKVERSFGHQLGKIEKLARLLDLELVVVCR